MSQKFAKKQATHPTSYNKTFNGSIVISSGKGIDAVGKFTEEKIISHPSTNVPIVESTRTVSIPAGSGVYLM
jgi:hypothetical protein